MDILPSFFPFPIFFLLLSWHRRIVDVDIIKVLLTLEEVPISNILSSDDLKQVSEDPRG